MAGLALLGGGLAFFYRCGGHHRLNRLLRFLGRDRVAGLGRLLGRENGAGPDIERERDQAGAKNGAQDLVEFEGIHRNEALEREASRQGTESPPRARRRRTDTVLPQVWQPV